MLDVKIPYTRDLLDMQESINKAKKKLESKRDECMRQAKILHDEAENCQFEMEFVGRAGEVLLTVEKFADELTYHSRKLILTPKQEEIIHSYLVNFSPIASRKIENLIHKNPQGFADQEENYTELKAELDTVTGILAEFGNEGFLGFGRVTYNNARGLQLTDEVCKRLSYIMIGYSSVISQFSPRILLKNQ